MACHFRAFTFVDRVTGFTPGASIRGQYSIPAGVPDFPMSLVAESVGQLAAWAAMATIGFTHRPVAGIAGRIELLSPVHPGQVLNLAATIESVDDETVAYAGTADVAGTPVIRLHDCVGPMVPLEEFDDPQLVRERFHLIQNGGATPGGFDGLPPLVPGTIDIAPGHSTSAHLRVPRDDPFAPFFADHFPRRPVFPGTLLTHSLLQTAAVVLATIPVKPGLEWVPREISNVKLRTFIPPGESLQLEARCNETEASDGTLAMTVESRLGGRLVGSAEIEFRAESKS